MQYVVIVVPMYICDFYLLEDDPGQAENVNLPMLSEKITQE